MKKTLPTFFSLLILFFFCSIFLPKTTQAQVPQPHVECSEVRPQLPMSTEDEFHSLRPYQASPCDESVHETVLYCGNDVIVKQTFLVSPCSAPNEDGACEYEVSSSVRVNIDLSDMELPIMGNTQLVPNSQNNTDQLSDPGTRMNEYVSWYLNGMVGRAEEEPLKVEKELGLFNTPILTEESHSLLVNYSGPLRKLLPWRVQADTREKTINKILEAQHNQVVGCSRAGVPVPCYDENFWTAFLEGLASGAAGTAGPLARELFDIDEQRLSQWANALPPKEEEYSSLRDYWLDYKKWRGSVCLNLPFAGGYFYVCTPEIVQPYIANLFSYIPFSSGEGGANQGPTEDRKGEVIADLTQTTQPSKLAGVQITEIEFIPDTQRDDVYFTHMQEVSQLATLLQNTYKPQGVGGFSGNTGEGAELYDTYRCELETARWNSGDDLFAEWNRGEYGSDPETGAEGTPYGPITGTINYKAKFTCDDFSSGGGIDEDCFARCIARGVNSEICSSECAQGSKCEKDILTALSVYTKTPKANEVWERLVAGNQSIFKRIFPGALLAQSEVKDFPAVTTAHYQTSSLGSSATVKETKTYAGDPTKQRLGSNANIFIPHIGGVQDYFLKAIQKALRPKDVAGVSEQLFCTVENSGIQSQELLKIIKDAASWAHVPVEALIAVVRVEGCGGGGTENLCSLTDEQVKTFSQPGAAYGYNCVGSRSDDNPDNQAKGPMQFYHTIYDGSKDCGGTGKLVHWGLYREAVNLATGEGRTPQICNIKDSIYAAAWVLSSVYPETCPPARCPGEPGYDTSSTPPANLWTLEDMKRVLSRWASGCSYGPCEHDYADKYCDIISRFTDPNSPDYIKTDCN